MDGDGGANRSLGEATVPRHLGVTLEHVAVPRVIVERDRTAEGISELGVRHAPRVLPVTNPDTKRARGRGAMYVGA